VKVGTVIALIAEEGEDASSVKAPAPQGNGRARPGSGSGPGSSDACCAGPGSRAPARCGSRAGEERRWRPDQGEPAPPAGSPRRRAWTWPASPVRVRAGGSSRRISRRRPALAPARVETEAPAAAEARPAVAAPALVESETPHEIVKLSNMRKTIARRLTEAKQTIPHIYLTVDIQLDALLKLRGELNKGLESRGVKLSVNDLMIKALAVALVEVPECNVSISGDQLLKYSRADIFGRGVDPRRPDHADRRRRRRQVGFNDLEGDGRSRRPRQGGQAAAARISGRHRQPLQHGHVRDQAVRRGDQSAAGHDHGDRRRREAPYVVDDSLQIATVMSATGSFDHRAIDGADGARLMQAFKRLVENPLGMLA
jgi:pyruvate dehydrogenase E2 component (dihydrolipoamide acetyltransferase)